MPDSPTPHVMPLTVNADGLAVMLSCKVRKVRAMNAAGKLPRPIRVGGSVLWRVSEIQDWLAAGCPEREEWETRKAHSASRR